MLPCYTVFATAPRDPPYVLWPIPRIALILSCQRLQGLRMARQLNHPEVRVWRA